MSTENERRLTIAQIHREEQAALEGAVAGVFAKLRSVARTEFAPLIAAADEERNRLTTATWEERIFIEDLTADLIDARERIDGRLANLAKQIVLELGIE